MSFNFDNANSEEGMVEMVFTVAMLQHLTSDNGKDHIREVSLLGHNYFSGTKTSYLEQLIIMARVLSIMTTYISIGSMLENDGSIRDGMEDIDGTRGETLEKVTLLLYDKLVEVGRNDLLNFNKKREELTNDLVTSLKLDKKIESIDGVKEAK